MKTRSAISRTEQKRVGSRRVQNKNWNLDTREAFMRKFALLSFLLLAWGSTLFGKTIVFWQEGFPTVASQPLSRDTLLKALDDGDVVFAGIAELKDAATWKDADLLVLPY